MRIFLILMLFSGTLKADSTNINKAGVNFAYAKSSELLSFGVIGAGVLLKSENLTPVLAMAAICQLASISFYYKGCQYLIKANGITIRF